jgi:hypothetical protein
MGAFHRLLSPNPHSGSPFTLYLALGWITAFAPGCAGPTTPLGAVWALQPQKKTVVQFESTDEPRADAVLPFSSFPASPSSVPQPSRGLAGLRDALLQMGLPSQPSIHFDPPHQILHGTRTLKVIIDDPRGFADARSGKGAGEYDFKVRYHGHDVTRSFLLQARMTESRQGQRLVIEVPSVRLSARLEHLIEVGYRNRAGHTTIARYQPPVCRAFDSQKLRTTEEFRPGDAMLEAIQNVSLQTGFNPAFTAALIAQESAFNPRSVSLARALGLTQVTPIAETEITHQFTSWPRYPGLNQMPAPLLKLLVMSGKVNAENEWRLNPERSIRGGLAFAQILADRWLDSDSYSKISWDTDVEAARTRLILASYNSGYARVTQAISRYGNAWLTAPELREARSYVNRIFSLCDSFERTENPQGI